MSFLSTLLFLILLNGHLQAHPGVRDKKGCHVDSDNGHRHCHDIKKDKVSKKKKEERDKTAKKKPRSTSSVQ